MTPTRQSMTGWGRFPAIDAEVYTPSTNAEIYQHLQQPGQHFYGISRGLGRSYGDSALAAQILLTQRLDNFLDFNPTTGELRCCSGISLGTILDTFSARGWFLPVLPGTRHVSVGGAIASDVHGKNHHIDGCFSRHVSSLRLLLASGEVMQCSNSENADVFQATCGGMGLTGVILEASLQLRRISSCFMEQQSFRSSDLQESFALLDAHSSAHYSVAWLDCMARGKKLGRSILFLGRHCDDQNLSVLRKRRWNVPVSTPAALLNRYTLSAFNGLYYRVAGRRSTAGKLHYDAYFFPLDSISNWNRLYGTRGFLQYQFVLPLETGYAGIQDILKRVTTAGKGSFLAVLKKFGAANTNLLSFPIPGYTLTLDFKFETDLLPLLDELDSVVLAHGGRVYLAKDARMSEPVFKRSYPRWEEFAELREKLGADKVFNSMQSNRLGL